tara:strand:- start:1263 stop:1766 length:504 start_codon:yes stop_codon:yes gene_type:complete
VTQVIQRNYLEINSIKDLVENKLIKPEWSISLVSPSNFQINKFFYKNIGNKHRWVDRLVWPDRQWIEYSSNRNVKTYVLKVKDDFAGYFELIFHENTNEIEIAYLGVLEEYHNKKLGSFLLSNAIKRSFEKKIKRTWVHTCTLDHQNALKNYLARGMKIFKKETISI